jgi:hypothetical protein
MGNFEWVEFGAEITIDNEVDFPGAKLPALEDHALDYLDQALAADIEEARLNTAEEQSFIHLYKNDEQETK